MEVNNAQAQRPVMLNDGTRLVRIELSDVAYIEAKRHNCVMHLLDGLTSYHLTMTLAEVVAQLPQNMFIRICRSYVVNIALVRCIIARTAKLTTGHVLPIGDVYYDDFIARFTVLNQASSKF